MSYLAIILLLGMLIGLGFVAWDDAHGGEREERRAIDRMADQSAKRALRPAPARAARWAGRSRLCK